MISETNSSHSVRQIARTQIIEVILLVTGDKIINLCTTRNSTTFRPLLPPWNCPLHSLGWRESTALRGKGSQSWKWYAVRWRLPVPSEQPWNASLLSTKWVMSNILIFRATKPASSCLIPDLHWTARVCCCCGEGRNPCFYVEASNGHYKVFIRGPTNCSFYAISPFPLVIRESPISNFGRETSFSCFSAFVWPVRVTPASLLNFPNSQFIIMLSLINRCYFTCTVDAMCSNFLEIQLLTVTSCDS